MSVEILLQLFPEALLVHLLKAMLHPDIEVRVGAHHLFYILLIPSSNHLRRGVSSLRSSYPREPRGWRSDTSSTFSSITALLEKLRKEKDGSKVENHGNSVYDNNVEDNWKGAQPHKSSPSFFKLSSIIDKAAGSTSLAEMVRNFLQYPRL